MTLGVPTHAHQCSSAMRCLYILIKGLKGHIALVWLKAIIVAILIVKLNKEDTFDWLALNWVNSPVGQYDLACPKCLIIAIVTYRAWNDMFYENTPACSV